MKKIALSLLVALSCISAKAADGKSLFVSFNDGSKIEFALSTQPEITFGNDKMTVTSTATTASYELWKVSTFTYGITTGIQQIEANSKFAFEGDRLIVDGPPQQGERLRSRRKGCKPLPYPRRRQDHHPAG